MRSMTTRFRYARCKIESDGMYAGRRTHHSRGIRGGFGRHAGEDGRGAERAGGGRLGIASLECGPYRAVAWIGKVARECLWGRGNAAIISGSCGK